jgi:hypothetical protein
MTTTVVFAVIMGILVVASLIFGWRIGGRLTPPGETPVHIERRVWIGLGASLAIGVAIAVWLLWAIDHHHGALGVLVVVGLYFATHFGMLALRYRRHRRTTSK